MPPLLMRLEGGPEYENPDIEYVCRDSVPIESESDPAGVSEEKRDVRRQRFTRPGLPLENFGRIVQFSPLFRVTYW
jgi:hypothetical protein